MKDMERERGGEKEREREGWGERGEKGGGATSHFSRMYRNEP